MSIQFSKQVYRGFWFCPQCQWTRDCIAKSHEGVEGLVTLTVFKGNVFINGRGPKTSLYNKDLVSMDFQGDYDPVDVAGFIKVNAIRVKEYECLRSPQGNEVQNGTNGVYNGIYGSGIALW